MNITTLKETKKAKFLKVDNVEFWIKNAWLNDKGLTPAGLKSLEEEKNTLAFKEKTKDKTAYYVLDQCADWVGEKSIGIDLYCVHTDKKMKRVFVGKSLLRNVEDSECERATCQAVPCWVIDKAIRECPSDADFYGHQVVYV